MADPNERSSQGGESSINPRSLVAHIDGLSEMTIAASEPAASPTAAAEKIRDYLENLRDIKRIFEQNEIAQLNLLVKRFRENNPEISLEIIIELMREMRISPEALARFETAAKLT